MASPELPVRFSSGIENVEPETQPGAVPLTVEGKVDRVYDNAVFLTFIEDGEEKLAAFTPAKMYLNGETNLSTTFPTELALRHFLQEGTVVMAKVLPCVKESSPKLTFGSATGFHFVHLGNHDPKIERKVKSPSRVDKFVTHVVRVLWPGRNVEEPALTKNSSQELSNLINSIHSKLVSFSKDENGGTMNTGTPSWKLVHALPVWMPPSSMSSQAEENKFSHGVVKEILSPHGAVVLMAPQNRVFFSRSNIVYMNKPIGYTDDLKTIVKVGTRIQAAFSLSDEARSVNIHGFARQVRIKCDDEIVDSEEPPKNVRKCHKMKVTQLFQDESNTIVRGEAAIMTSPGSKVKQNSPLLGEVMTFERSAMHFGHVSLRDTDLAYLLRVRSSTKS